MLESDAGAIHIRPADAAAAVPDGGLAVSGAALAEMAAQARSAWLESGGSRARFEEGLKKRLGVAGGGRKIPAILSLARALQTAAWPALADDFLTVERGAGIHGEVVGPARETKLLIVEGETFNTVIEMGGGEIVRDGGRTNQTRAEHGGTQAVRAGGRAFQASANSGGSPTSSTAASRPKP
jgi:hypothetical protein